MPLCDVPSNPEYDAWLLEGDHLAAEGRTGAMELWQKGCFAKWRDVANGTDYFYMRKSLWVRAEDPESKFELVRADDAESPVQNPPAYAEADARAVRATTSSSLADAWCMLGCPDVQQLAASRTTTGDMAAVCDCLERHTTVIVGPLCPAFLASQLGRAGVPARANSDVFCSVWFL